MLPDSSLSMDAADTLPHWRLRRSLSSLARGALSFVLVMTGLLLATFALSSLSPVDPVLQMLGDHASASSYASTRHALGLDASLPRQFVHYVVRLSQGDLGISRSTGQPVRDDLVRVFPATLELATLAMSVSGTVGIALGLLAAWRPRGVMDQVIRAVSLFGNSVPVFWMGLLALYFFYARLHWTGGPGRLDDAFAYTIDMPSGLVLLDAWRSGEPGAFASAISHLVLPVLVLAYSGLGNVARLTRAAVLGELNEEYVILARAKGAGEARVLLRHVLPNVAGVLLTVLALGYAGLLEGAVLTETVFAWPGLGRYLTTALFAADMPAILGGTLVIGTCFVLVNGVTDLLVQLFDPRFS
jgi:peptide/nickel transport system permease protein